MFIIFSSASQIQHAPNWTPDLFPRKCSICHLSCQLMKIPSSQKVKTLESLSAPLFLSYHRPIFHKPSTFQIDSESVTSLSSHMPGLPLPPPEPHHRSPGLFWKLPSTPPCSPLALFCPLTRRQSAHTDR